MPEDGDRAASIQCESLMTSDLDQLSRLDCLIPSGFQIENLNRLLKKSALDAVMRT
jgi:hypothetical protein